jgi:hypothetical protein
MQSSLAAQPDAVRVPDARSLLEAWEAGVGQPPALRALAIAALAGELREALFGSRLECIADCPACDAQVELSFAVGDVLLSPQPSPAQVSVTVGTGELHARLPTAADLAALALAPARDPRDELLARCVADRPAPLPDEAADALAAALAAADPQADVRLALACPSCEERWSAPFDVATHLLGELDDWAQRMLWDIHALARAYGWREADTLELSPTRRRFYLEAIGA